MKIVIVGGSFSGIHCALKARELYPTARITVIEKQSEIGYIPSGLTLYLNDLISDLDEAHFIKASYLESKGITLRLSEEVMSYQFDKKQLTTDKEIIFYDRLVLATGSSQSSYKLSMEHACLLTYKTKASAQQVLQSIKTKHKLLIVGAGQAGMEMASALYHQNKEVEIIESMSYPLYKYFDQGFLSGFQRYLNGLDGITFTFNETVKAFEGEDEVILKGNEITRQGEAAVLTVNVRPEFSNVDQQLISNLDGTLSVSPYLETSEEDVFAIGDLIQVPDRVSGHPVYLPLISNAIKSGVVCAENLEKKTVAYTGTLRIVGTFLFDYYLASCGLTESDSFLYEGEVAVADFVKTVSTLNQETIHMKYVFDKETHRLLGVQLLSKANILERINRYALAIETNQTIEELEQNGMFYHPFFGSQVDGYNLAISKDVDKGEI